MRSARSSERALALDRHSDSIGRWRGQLAGNPDLARIWIAAQDDAPLERFDYFRFGNLWIGLTNAQRANFLRAQTVGASGLARQAVLSIAVMVSRSETMSAEWKINRPWHELESPEWVQSVDAAIEEFKNDTTLVYREAGALSRDRA